MAGIYGNAKPIYIKSRNIKRKYTKIVKKYNQVVVEDFKS